jgi:DNA-binding response OmpR family regulator
MMDKAGGGNNMILIIEDELSVRESIRDILALENLDCTLVESGEAGLTVARKTAPRMVVTDVQLPDVSGFQVCQDLKRDPASRHIPVVMMSGRFTDPEDKIQGLESGADDYFVKPFDPSYFLARIKSLLRTAPQPA